MVGGGGWVVEKKKKDQYVSTRQKMALYIARVMRHQCEVVGVPKKKDVGRYPTIDSLFLINLIV